MTTRTAMTIPATAPPESPPEPLWLSSVENPSITTESNPAALYSSKPLWWGKFKLYTTCYRI